MAVCGLIDYGQLITGVHLCVVICHSWTQALTLPADRAGNTFESEQFITHFISIVFALSLFIYTGSLYL